VSNPAVTAESHITVTLTANPGTSTRIHWVARHAGSFTVHLTQAVSSATSFTYLIVEPFDRNELKRRRSVPAIPASLVETVSALVAS
jgi:hypothetical protein